MTKAICAQHSIPLILGLCLVLTASLSPVQAWGQDSSANTVQGTFPCALEKSLDSKKAKDGDPVVCQTSKAFHDSSGRFMPSGTKIMGHVTQAQARSKGDAQSSLALVFDKIELSKGNDVPIKGVLQAVGPGFTGGPDTGPATEPGLHGGAALATQGQTMGKEGGTHASAAGPLSGDSKGAVGVKGLDMGDNSVLTSTGKEVKLDAGTQMVVRAE
jgi:hypothetical protein